MNLRNEQHQQQKCQGIQWFTKLVLSGNKKCCSFSRYNRNTFFLSAVIGRHTFYLITEVLKTDLEDR